MLWGTSVDGDKGGAIPAGAGCAAALPGALPPGARSGWHAIEYTVATPRFVSISTRTFPGLLTLRPEHHPYPETTQLPRPSPQFREFPDILQARGASTSLRSLPILGAVKAVRQWTTHHLRGLPSPPSCACESRTACLPGRHLRTGRSTASTLNSARSRPRRRAPAVDRSLAGVPRAESHAPGAGLGFRTGGCHAAPSSTNWPQHVACEAQWP